MKDFVSLVLDEKGKLSSRSQAGYNVFTFKHEKKKFFITWWSSSKTFIIQGEEKYSDKIQSKIQNLLKNNSEKGTELDENTTPKRKRNKKRGKNKDCKNSKDDVIDDSFKGVTQAHLQNVWLA